MYSFSLTSELLPLNIVKTALYSSLYKHLGLHYLSINNYSFLFFFSCLLSKILFHFSSLVVASRTNTELFTKEASTEFASCFGHRRRRHFGTTIMSQNAGGRHFPSWVIFPLQHSWSDGKPKRQTEGEKKTSKSAARCGVGKGAEPWCDAHQVSSHSSCS